MYVRGGLGCGTCNSGYSSGGLGLLPSAGPVTGPNLLGLSQYDALKSGKAVGGNFEMFTDAVKQGFFEDSREGYGNYLMWNSGTSTTKASIPGYYGWDLAARAATYVNRYHTGNSLSPLYTTQTAWDMAVKSLQGIKRSLSWSDAQYREAVDAFEATYPRLLAEWGKPPMSGPVAVPAVVAAPTSANIRIPTAWIVSDTTDAATKVRTLVYTDPTRGRITMTGYVQADGSSAAPTGPAAPTVVRQGVEIMLSKSGSPGTGLLFLALAWRHVSYWSNNTRTFGVWERWGGFTPFLSGTNRGSMFLEDAGYTAQSKAYFDWPALQQVIAQPERPSNSPQSLPPNVTQAVTPIPSGTSLPQPGQTIPVVTSPSNTVPAPIVPQVKPWVDVAVPDPFGPTILPSIPDTPIAAPIPNAAPQPFAPSFGPVSFGPSVEIGGASVGGLSPAMIGTGLLAAYFLLRKRR